MAIFERGQRVFCCCESVYAPALEYAREYRVLDHDDEHTQIQIQNEQGRTRWYPAFCFADTIPVRLVQWRFDDPIEQPFCEVSMSLSDGSRRWCIFTTPRDFELEGDWLDEEQGVRWHQPCAHLFILTRRSEELVSKALAEVERQGQLVDSSVLFEDDSHDEDS